MFWAAIMSRWKKMLRVGIHFALLYLSLPDCVSSSVRRLSTSGAHNGGPCACTFLAWHMKLKSGYISCITWHLASKHFGHFQLCFIVGLDSSCLGKTRIMDN